MKKILMFFTMLILTAVYGQNVEQWRNMKPDERKQYIEKLSPDERLKLLKNFRENMMVDELDVPQERQQEFKSLYNEYQDSQKRIKGNFKSRENYNELSDAEAKEELEKSFNVGQQLLDNRRRYAERFQRVMKPQQVLEMFQNEGMMRNKMMDHKSEIRSGNTYQKRGNAGFENNSGNKQPLRNNNSGRKGFRN